PALLLNLLDQPLDSIDGRQDQRHRALRLRRTITQFADQGLGAMRYILQPVQAEKTGSTFDGMNETENASDQRSIGRIALALNELIFGAFDMLRRFNQKVSQ